MAENVPLAPPRPLLDWLAASIAEDFEGTDPIRACGESLLSALPRFPHQVLRLAHEKLHSFPYHDVPICWRRLFEEASLHTVLATTNRAENHHYRASPRQNDWVSDVVQILDKAAIISGLPRREALVHRIIVSLETLLYGPSVQSSQNDSEPCPKRRKVECTSVMPDEQVDQFATSLAYEPKIEHAIATCHNPSIDQFQEHLLTNNNSPTPLIIQNALMPWPALSDNTRSWANPRYLQRKTLGGRRLAPVEFGRSYTDAGWGQRIITFSDFMNDCLLQEINGTDPSSAQIDDFTGANPPRM